MCHKFQMRECWYPHNKWCNFGYHITKEEEEEEETASKKRSAAFDDMDPKRPKELANQQSESPAATSKAHARPPYAVTEKRFSADDSKHISLNLAKAALGIIMKESPTKDMILAAYAKTNAAEMLPSERKKVDDAFWELVTEVSSKSASSQH